MRVKGINYGVHSFSGSFMMDLSIIIGFEEIESRSAFDVVASRLPIYHYISSTVVL